MNDKPFEIPDSIREMAERNVEQAREAYDQFVSAAQKAQTMVEKSSDAVAGGARDVQSVALEFTQKNMTASFAFASQLANARDMKEALELQQKFAQEQIKSYTEQTQELGKIMAKATEKAQKS